MRMICVALAAVLLSAGSAAVAGGEDFMQCDGFLAPTAKSDSISSATFLWGLASRTADVRPADTSLEFGAAGAGACGRALSDPLLLPAYALRRAHLLQFDALHQLAAQKPADALEDTKRAEEVAALLDAQSRASLAPAAHAIRAATLAKLDRVPEAKAEADALRQLRPYAAGLAELASALSVAADDAPEARITELRLLAPLAPGAISRLFEFAFMERRYSLAIEMGRQIVFDLPATRGGWTVEGADERRYDLIPARATISGAIAYALAATNDEAAAAATLATARRLIDEAAAPPPTPPAGETLGKRVKQDYARRNSEGDIARMKVNFWEEAIALRKALPTLPPTDGLAKLAAFAHKGLPVGIDLLTRVRADNAADRTARDAAAADHQRRMETAREQDEALTPEKIAERLPKVETTRMRPKFKQSGDGYFLSANGFSKRADPTDGTFTIRFTDNLASKPTVEELALLSAATLALQQKHDGFIILSRRTLEQTTHIIEYYRQVADVPTGNEAELKVAFVDKGKLPPIYGGMDWRVLDAGQVRADLLKQYPEAAAPPAR